MHPNIINSFPYSLIHSLIQAWVGGGAAQVLESEGREAQLYNAGGEGLGPRSVCYSSKTLRTINPFCFASSNLDPIAKVKKNPDPDTRKSYTSLQPNELNRKSGEKLVNSPIFPLKGIRIYDNCSFLVLIRNLKNRKPDLCGKKSPDQDIQANLVFHAIYVNFISRFDRNRCWIIPTMIRFILNCRIQPKIIEKISVI